MLRHRVPRGTFGTRPRYHADFAAIWPAPRRDDHGCCDRLAQRAPHEEHAGIVEPLGRGGLFAALTLVTLQACGARSGVGEVSADAAASEADAGVLLDAEALEAQTPADEASPADAPAPVDDGAPIDCGAPSIDGTWHGTIDGFQSASGSNAVTMTFALQGDGATVGTVYFGGSTAPPPPTDPDVGYPPGLFSSHATTNLAAFFPDGFRHTAHDVVFDGVRLRLRIWTDDVWSAWCSLQTRTYREPESDGSPPFYECEPDWAFTSDGNGTCQIEDPSTSTFVPVDCGKWALC